MTLLLSQQRESCFHVFQTSLARCRRTNHRSGIQSDIHWEWEFAPHSRIASGNIGAVDGRRIPAIDRKVYSLDPFVDSLTIGCVDPFHFVEVPVETFRQYCLVIALRDQVVSYHQYGTGLDDQILEL